MAVPASEIDGFTNEPMSLEQMPGLGLTVILEGNNNE
jgi:hypothetical protein